MFSGLQNKVRIVVVKRNTLHTRTRTRFRSSLYIHGSRRHNGTTRKCLLLAVRPEPQLVLGPLRTLSPDTASRFLDPARGLVVVPALPSLGGGLEGLLLVGNPEAHPPHRLVVDLDVRLADPVAVPRRSEGRPPLLPLSDLPIVAQAGAGTAETTTPNRWPGPLPVRRLAAGLVLRVAAQRRRDVRHLAVLRLAPEVLEGHVAVLGPHQSIVMFKTIGQAVGSGRRHHAEHQAAPIAVRRRGLAVCPIRLPAHEHELSPLQPVGLRREGHQVPQQQGRVLPVLRGRPLHDHVALVLLHGLAVQGRMELPLLVGSVRRRRWARRSRSCGGARRRWARRRGEAGDGLLQQAARVHPAVQRPSSVARFWCEAVVLLKDDEESVVIQPGVRGKGDDHVLNDTLAAGIFMKSYGGGGLSNEIT